MRILAVGLFAAFATGCATTYSAPQTVAPEVSSTVDASRGDIISSAKRVLVTEGFQITSADANAGIVSTAPQNLRVTPAVADCGSTMGLDYLSDNRTTTQVSYGILAEDGKVTVKATIQGEYKPGSVTQDITLTCVSRGKLEKKLLSKITAGL
jgi:hypothetical protein